MAAYTLGMRGKPNLKTVSDDELLRRLSELVQQSRRVEADVVALIGEVEARRLYEERGHGERGQVSARQFAMPRGGK